MKLAAGILGLAASVLYLLCRSAAAQSLPATSTLTASAGPTEYFPGACVLFMSQPGKQPGQVRTNLPPQARAQTNAPAAIRRFRPGNRAPGAQLKPGIYETAPYTCIVVVPGPHPDDKSNIGDPGNTAEMPTLKPELRFIPRKAVP